jgi:hypothetical protein
MRWHNNVGVQDCGVNVVSTNRLQREFGCKFWLLDGFKDASLAADLSVFGETATCLTHEPHGGVG